jgi:hypothetical protein
MNSLIYLPAGPEGWNLDLNKQPIGPNHFRSRSKPFSFLWPETINRENISPQVFRILKDRLTIDTIWLADQARGIKSPVYVSDHINRSGINFLVGNTFSEDSPTFPDSSGIYSLPEDRSGRVVVSVGSERFNKVENINTHPLCEWVGSIAPVWSYVGVRVIAVAAPTGMDILSFLIDEMR